MVESISLFIQINKPKNQTNMKTNVKQSIIALVMFIILIASYNVMRSQTLTIHPSVTLDDRSCFETVKVVIVDLDTVDAKANVTLNVIKGFTYPLEDNKEYLLVFIVDGFTSKSVAISTNHTANQRYLYEFIVNLSSKDPVPDVKYAGGIFWNKKKQKFDYHIES